MKELVKGILDCDVQKDVDDNAAELDGGFKTAKELIQALKKGEAAVKQHVTTKQNRAAANVKAAKKLEEKEQLATVTEQAKKMARKTAKTPSAASRKLPPLRLVELQQFTTAAKSFESLDEVPVHLAKNEVVQGLLAHADVSKAMSSYSCDHKKDAKFKDAGRTQSPCAAAIRDLLSAAVGKLPIKDAADISSNPGGPAFMKAGWMWAFTPDMSKPVLMPQAAAMLRFVFAGTVELHMMSMSTAVKAKLVAPSSEASETDNVPSIEAIGTALSNLNLCAVRALRDSGHPIFHCCVSSGEAAWIPQGWIVLESGHTGPLIFGLRKSVFTSSEASVKEYEVSCKAVASAGQPVERHEAILQSLKDPKDIKPDAG